jgi:hypothetical protein
MAVFRRFSLVAGSVMAAAAIGLAGAGTASASTTAAIRCIPDGISLGNLGVEQGVCAYAQGQSMQIKMLPYPEGANVSMTKWFYPTASGKYGQIRQASGPELCMQLNYDNGKALVVESGCNKSEPSYQMWKPEFIAVPGGATMVEYQSGWHTALNLCLTFDKQGPASNYQGVLDARTCSPAEIGAAWYQVFAA